MNEKNTQYFSDEQKKEFAGLLKLGLAECRDFTDETLQEMIKDGFLSVNELPNNIKGNLMNRCIIPADFTCFEPAEQLELLLCDVWYGLDDPKLGSQLKAEAYSADEMVLLLRHHPGVERYCAGWDWKKTASASSESWYKLLNRHCSYAQYCPEDVWKNFTSAERFSLASSQPGLAEKLELDTLPAEMRDVILRNNPELAGYFTFAENNPPGKLFFSRFLDNCNEQEAAEVGNFLANLLPDMSPEEGFEMADGGEGLLGIFPQSRGKVLEAQIRRFLLEKNISEIALNVYWRLLPQPLFFPRDNTEARIMQKHKSKIVQACFEDKPLSRVDVLLTEEFQTLRRDIRCLVLRKALPPELREFAVYALTENGANADLINEAKEVFSFKENDEEFSSKALDLLEAIVKDDIETVKKLVPETTIPYLSADEALDIFYVLPGAEGQIFFDECINDVLRAYLITELLAKKQTNDVVALLNILLQTYWRSDAKFLGIEYDTFATQE